MTAAIEIAGLRKNYGSHVALRGIDLSVQPGEVFGFIGPNGAGKTTTMRILLDILRPSAGSVRVLGTDPRAGGADLRRRIGYLPGELRLDGRYDVATLLDYYVNLSAPGARPDPSRPWRPIAERLGLDVTRQVRGLSKGNKQKVGLVQAFVHRPELLILDEPTSGLDPLVQAEFLAMVREAKADGQTVFLSSHVLSEIEQAADTVAVLRTGDVVLESSVGALRAGLGCRVRLRLAGEVTADGFRGLTGVRDVRAESDRDAGHTLLTLQLDGPPDAVVKAAARHTVLELDAERPDLEEAVMALYSKDQTAADRPDATTVRS